MNKFFRKYALLILRHNSYKKIVRSFAIQEISLEVMDREASVTEHAVFEFPFDDEFSVYMQFHPQPITYQGRPKDRKIIKINSGLIDHYREIVEEKLKAKCNLLSINFDDLIEHDQEKSCLSMYEDSINLARNIDNNESDIISPLYLKYLLTADIEADLFSKIILLIRLQIHTGKWMDKLSIQDIDDQIKYYITTVISDDKTDIVTSFAEHSYSYAQSKVVDALKSVSYNDFYMLLYYAHIEYQQLIYLYGYLNDINSQFPLDIARVDEGSATTYTGLTLFFSLNENTNWMDLREWINVDNLDYEKAVEKVNSYSTVTNPVIPRNLRDILKRHIEIRYSSDTNLIKSNVEALEKILSESDGDQLIKENTMYAIHLGYMRLAFTEKALMIEQKMLANKR